MSSIKKIMIVLGIGIIIVIILLLLLLGKLSEMGEGTSLGETTQEEKENVQIKTELKKNNIPNLYFGIQDSITKYFTYLEAQNAEAILDILEQEYCDTNAINVNNVLQNSPQIVDFKYFKVKEMYLLEKENKYKNYVYGIITMGENVYAWYGEVNTDYESFTIQPLEKNDYENMIANKIDTGDKKLVLNIYNQFVETQITEEQLCSYYLEDYREKLLNEPETAFSILEEQYKEKRFNNDYSRFLQYIEDNRQHIELMTLASYSTYNDSYEGNRILLKDTYENYYIIHENAVMDYTILLDSYTVPMEEYIQKYNGLSSEAKVLQNVEVVINMINNKDFEAMYTLLDKDFKNNYFANFEAYEQYMRNNFFDYNIIGNKNIEEINGLFVCEVFLKDSAGRAYESKQKTFIMQLGEGTDFVMSFQV